MHFKFSTWIGDWDLCCAAFYYSVPPCDALYNISQVDFNFCSLFHFISPKELYKHLNPQLMKNSCKFKCATWRFHFDVSSSRFHSFILSHARSSPHIFSFFLAHAIYVYQRDDTVVSFHGAKKEAQKSCRWVIVMVTYTRYTQNIRKDLSIRLMFGNVQWSVKKSIEIVFFVFLSVTFCLGPFSLPRHRWYQQKLAKKYTHRKTTPASMFRLRSLLFFDDTIKTMGDEAPRTEDCCELF